MKVRLHTQRLACLMNPRFPNLLYVCLWDNRWLVSRAPSATSPPDGVRHHRQEAHSRMNGSLLFGGVRHHRRRARSKMIDTLSLRPHL